MAKKKSSQAPIDDSEANPTEAGEAVKKPAAKRARSKPAAAAAEGDDAAATLPEKAAKAPRKFKDFVPTEPNSPTSGPLYDESLRPPKTSEPATRLVSWNVAGLRAILRKDPQAFSKLVSREDLDVICLQEIKMSDSHVAEVEALLNLPGWHTSWNCCTAKAGSKPLSTLTEIGLADLDKEGRVLATEFEGFWLVNTYVPNSGAALARLTERTKTWDPAFAEFCKGLEAKGKPVVITGDLNCAHKEIDIHDPKGNKKSAGFTIEERDSFQACLIDRGFVDTFRSQHPDKIGFTYYSLMTKARETGKGWRVDYFLVSQSLAERCHDSFILKCIEGSDHVPLGLVVIHPPGPS